MRLHLRLRLLIGVVLILHRVADCEAAHAAYGRADRSARARCADRSADDRTGSGADSGAADRAFFTRRERIARASCDQEDRYERE